MPVDEEILKELKKISKIITISNGSSIERELSKYATSDDRKKIWVLIDGNRNSDQISKEIGVTKRAVDMALQSFENASLIEERKYGVPPKRVVDYVPAEWIDLLSKNPKSAEEAKPVISEPSNQPSQEAAPNV